MASDDIVNIAAVRFERVAGDCCGRAFYIDGNFAEIRQQDHGPIACPYCGGVFQVLTPTREEVLQVRVEALEDLVRAMIAAGAPGRLSSPRVEED